jgi:hypothetical protein
MTDNLQQILHVDTVQSFYREAALSFLTFIFLRNIILEIEICPPNHIDDKIPFGRRGVRKSTKRLQNSKLKKVFYTLNF